MGPLNKEQFIEDMRKGLSEVELREKHDLDASQFREELQMLVRGGYLGPAEVYGWAALYNKDMDLVRDIRLLNREHVQEAVTIYEEGRPDIRGVVFDFSEIGLGIGGIQSEENQAKRFVLPTSGEFAVDRFVFTAVCRWAKNSERPEDSVAGYEIQAFIEGNRERLKAYLARQAGPKSSR